MGTAHVLSRANRGLDAPQVLVEVHLSNGLPAFTIVGMAETAVRESRDRVRSALINSHFEFPDRRITVSLAPADLPKGGGRFDLPIALGILIASDQLPQDALGNTECIGELALDGSLRGTKGCLAATLATTALQRRMLLPSADASICSAVPGAIVIAADNLLSCCAILRGRAPSADIPTMPVPAAAPGQDLKSLRGQPQARRALEIAAVGGHNLLLIGPPGSGKSLLASCLPSILPRPEDQESLVTAALYDLRGEMPNLGVRPFRQPHHSASAAALVGGGSVPRPGEASLAHGGVLFLDELPEFSRHALDMLREPIETGEVRIARSSDSLRFPARFQLVAAMNPCKCGYAGDPAVECRCSTADRQRYENRVSGPLMDRIDIRVRVSRESAQELLNDSENESSELVAKRVAKARDHQMAARGQSNSVLVGKNLIEACAMTAESRTIVTAAADQLQLSGRAIHRLLRVARSIADLGGIDTIGPPEIYEALSYREGGASQCT